MVTQSAHVTGHFNAHLRACCVLVANEAFFAGDKQHESTLKALITEPTLMIEAKGIDSVQAPNRISIIVMSNEEWVVPAGPTARRFVVFDCGDAHRQDTAYFGAVQRQLDSGGYEALLWHLQNEVDLTGFDPHKAIWTEALAEQQALSLKGIESVWYECLYSGVLRGAVRNGGEFYLRPSDLIDWAAKKNRRDWKNISTEQVGLLLGFNSRGNKGMGFREGRIQFTNGTRPRYRVIPRLAEARAKWDEVRFKVPEWPEAEDWELPED